MDGRIQEIRARIRGPVNSIPTTFTCDGEIDWPGIRNSIEIGITSGSDVSRLTFSDSQFDFLNDQEVAGTSRRKRPRPTRSRRKRPTGQSS